MPVVAIVVAAGSGSRLGAAVPKALVPLDGVPLVRRCADALVAGGVAALVVSVPDGFAPQVEEALAGVGVPVRLVVGGARRQDSVRLAAEALGEEYPDATVLVHDAARPLVPPVVVRTVADAVAAGADAVLPAVPVVDSVREVHDGGSRVVDRSHLRAVQTPQGFPLRVLLDAHRQVEARGLEVTDDAGAAELAGYPVSLVPGHRDALKVTEPIDLVLAHAVLAGRRG